MRHTQDGDEHQCLRVNGYGQGLPKKSKNFVPATVSSLDPNASHPAPPAGYLITGDDMDTVRGCAGRSARRACKPDGASAFPIFACTRPSPCGPIAAGCFVPMRELLPDFAAHRRKASSEFARRNSSAAFFGAGCAPAVRCSFCVSATVHSEVEPLLLNLLNLPVFA